MTLCGAVSAFLNNTPIVVLAAPVIRDVSASVGLDPRRYLMPLSYLTVLGGCCTLIGTSTNLLVNDMARASGSRELHDVRDRAGGPGGRAGRRRVPVLLLRPPDPSSTTPPMRPTSAERARPAPRRPFGLGRQRRACSRPSTPFRPWRALASLGGVRRRGHRRVDGDRADRRDRVRRGGAADPDQGDRRRRGLSRAAARNPHADRRDGGDRRGDGGNRAGRRGDRPAGRLDRPARPAVRADPVLRRGAVPDRAAVQRHRRGAADPGRGEPGRRAGGRAPSRSSPR